jgi:hypothetical protein
MKMNFEMATLSRGHAQRLSQWWILFPFAPLNTFLAQNFTSFCTAHSNVEAVVSTGTTVTRLSKAPRSYSDEQHLRSNDPQATKYMMRGYNVGPRYLAWWRLRG